MDAVSVETPSVQFTTEAKSIARFDKAQARLIRDEGFGSTTGGMAVTKSVLKKLSAAVSVEIEKTVNTPGASLERDFVYVLRRLDVDVISLSILQTSIHMVALEKGHRDTLLALGMNIAGELWAADLLMHDAQLHKRISRAVKLRHGNVKYRKQAARSIAKRLGFQSRQWTKEELIVAGTWLVNVLTRALPDIFEWQVSAGGDRWLTLSPDAHDKAVRVIEDTIYRTPVHLPTLTPPVLWTDWNVGGYEDARNFQRTQLVRSRVNETQAAVRAAIKSGQMQPTLDAINAAQAVPFKINTRVMEVINWCYENDVPVEGLPRRTDIPRQEKLPDAEWEAMSAEQKRARKYRGGQIKGRNRALISDRILFAEDMRTAALLAEAPEFYTPCNCDWRGRIYPLPHFNFQRDDRVRALFLFAQGERITEEALWWLKVHVANCGDFDKISKRSLEERVEWVEQHSDLITKCAQETYSQSALSFWTKADKPFLFLASCTELASSTLTDFKTHLPISFDGSCSGLQHLCAATRAPEGSLVNLTNESLPQDIYATVAGKVETRLNATTSPLSHVALSYGINRNFVKRNVMTYSYSSKKFGMSEQLMEDVMRPLGFEVLEGLRAEHPFAVPELDIRTDKETGEVRPLAPGTAASKYLAAHVYDAIEEIVEKPAEAMAFLQKLARALAHEGKPLNWVTPTGLPWSNRYHVALMKTVELWLSDVRVQMRLTVGDKKEIDKDKAANGVAPNFVHALDAAHLMLTVNASVREGITQIATVHDSFGCLATHAKRFNEIIREQFVAMYEQHDVLAEVLQQAKCDLTLHNLHRLPPMVGRGSLDIKEVLNARYAFA